MFRYLKRNVPLVSTVPRFCVPIDYKRTRFLTRSAQNIHFSVKEEHFDPSSQLRVEHIVLKLIN